MVHWENISHILTHGLCCFNHKSVDPNYINIGHQQLIADRHNHQIPLNEKGTLGEYIPFYFAGHSPMLYLIMNGYANVVRRSQIDIVYIVIDFKSVVNNGLDYVFTDRNAKIAVANYYESEHDFNKLNWNTIKSKNWKNTEDDYEKEDLKQAEFLIRNHIPISCIHALVVKTPERKTYFDGLIAENELEIEVHVDNKCKLYY